MQVNRKRKKFLFWVDPSSVILFCTAPLIYPSRRMRFFALSWNSKIAPSARTSKRNLTAQQIGSGVCDLIEAQECKKDARRYGIRGRGFSSRFKSRTCFVFQKTKLIDQQKTICRNRQNRGVINFDIVDNSTKISFKLILVNQRLRVCCLKSPKKVFRSCENPQFFSVTRKIICDFSLFMIYCVSMSKYINGGFSNGNQNACALRFQERQNRNYGKHDQGRIWPCDQRRR